MDRRALDDAWAAGFFDGEGHIGIQRFASKTYRDGTRWRLVITASQNDKRPLDELVRLYGGRVSPSYGAGARWVWHLPTSLARTFLRRVYPHMRTKQEQARVALEYLGETSWGTRRLTDEEHERRQRLADELLEIRAVARL